MKKRINISIDEDLIKQIDESRGKISRSEAVEAAIFNELARKKPQIKTIQEIVEEELKESRKQESRKPLLDLARDDIRKIKTD